MSIKFNRIKKVAYEGDSLHIMQDGFCKMYLEENGKLDSLSHDGTGLVELTREDIINLWILSSDSTLDLQLKEQLRIADSQGGTVEYMLF